MILLGGMVWLYGGQTLGPMTIGALSEVRADKAILGMNGVSTADGLTTPNPLVAEVKKAMVSRARELIVVADHSRLDTAAMCQVAPISRVRTLVTDAGITEHQKSQLVDAGVEVLLA